MSMNVYFGASVSLDRTMLPLYQRIVSVLKELGHKVLSEHVVDPLLIPGANLSPKRLFQRETALIDKAEVMVAEVTAPSWGTAFLIEHALAVGKPVLALYFKDHEKPLPMMIKGHPELYVQHYDESNIEVVVKKSLDHFSEEMKRKGKLVVIDGADGSGKATQTQMLLDYLGRVNKKYKYIDFPRYYTSFHGKVVGRYLAGEFGDNKGANPYMVSLAFALDRLTAREEIVEWLKEANLYDSTLIYVMTDHGFDMNAKTHNNAPHSWLATNDKLVTHGGIIADVPATILTRFGIDCTKLEPHLIGKSLE